jgi:hypothetical protein
VGKLKMASTYRFYLAKTIGDGKAPETAFRSKLSDHLPVGDIAQNYWSWANDTHKVMFCLAVCPTGLHARITADPDITPLSPELEDKGAVDRYLDTPMGGAHPDSAVLEANGIPCDWITPETTHRELWRFIVARHSITQRLFGKRHPDLEHFKKPLDAMVPSGKSHREHLKNLVVAGGHADLHFGPVKF